MFHSRGGVGRTGRSPPAVSANPRTPIPHHYQVRGYPAWYRHIALVDGHGRPSDDRAPRRSRRGISYRSDALIPLTINEIRRLIHRVSCPVRHALVHVWHWSNWRRAAKPEPAPAIANTDITNCRCNTNAIWTTDMDTTFYLVYAHLLLYRCRGHADLVATDRGALGLPVPHL